MVIGHQNAVCRDKRPGSGATAFRNDADNGFRVFKKVHNAFLMFRRGNSFLDFYTDTAVRLLSRNTGSVPPQFIGPKLLTALHNIAGLPVMDAAGMFSPAVIRDLVRGEGAALDLFVCHSPTWPAAANLCISSCERGELDDATMTAVIDRLLDSSADQLDDASPL